MGPLKRVCIKADGAPVPLCVGIHSLGAAVWLSLPRPLVWDAWPRRQSWETLPRASGAALWVH